MQEEFFDKLLPCKLTDAELDARRDALAEECARRDALQEEKKQAAADMKALIDKSQDKIAETAREIRERRTFRKVCCRQEIDHVGDIARVVREDTGEVIDERPLQASERQLTLVRGGH